MTDQERLEQLIRAEHPCITMTTHEEDYALSLVRDASLHLSRGCLLWSINGGLRDGLVARADPIPETEHPAAALFHLTRLKEQTLDVTVDLAAHLRDERTLRLLRDLIRRLDQTGSTLVMIDHSDALPEVIVRYSIPFEIALPQEDELERIVRDTLKYANRKAPIQAKMSRSAFRTIVRNLRGLTRRQAERIIIDCVAQDRHFDADDVNTVLARKRQTLGRDGLLEFVEIPVDLSEIGGLRRLKSWLKVRQKSLTDEAVAFGLSAPRGVLMLGVQGAGKSLCAKAIATAWQRPLLRMDVGALYDRYIGESERRLREALRQAEMMAPIVLWIDEIEKAFASAAAQSADGGLSQRMFGSLLSWLQDHSEPIFVVATANDIQALPPELMRKGRFDEIFFVDLPDESARRQIFSVHLRRRGRDPAGFDLAVLAAGARGFSGAEIEQAVAAALYTAFRDGGEIDTALILAELAGTRPLSVTMAERIAELRAWAAERCVPADG